MNRTQKFMLNSMVSAASQIVALIVGFITPTIMIGTYGSEVNGLVSSLHQFINYIMLVEAGLSGAIVYSLYKPLADRDHGKVSSIAAAAQKSYAQVGYIFSSGILILAVVYAFLKNSDTLPFYMIFCLTLVFGANGCLDFFILARYKVLFNADQKLFITTSVGIAQTILRTVIVCLCAFFKLNVVVLYTVALLPLILKVVVLLYVGKKQYPYLDPHAQPDQTALNKRWDVIYQQILGTVQSGAPTVLATFLVSLSQVSVYTVYNMILTGINGILGIFISGLPAGFGEVIAKGEIKTLQKTTSEFEVAYYYILSVVYGITMVMLLPFISIYTRTFTDVNYYVPALAVVIVLNGLLYNIKTPQSMLILSAGMYKETRGRVTVQGALIIVFGALFGYLWGLVGIMLGSCISNLYRTIDLLFFVPKNITYRKGFTSAFRMLRVLLNIALIVLPSWFIPVQASGYVGWVMYACAYGIWALVVTTLTTLMFDAGEFFAVVRRLKATLQRR